MLSIMATIESAFELATEVEPIRYPIDMTYKHDHLN